MPFCFEHNRLIPQTLPMGSAFVREGEIISIYEAEDALQALEASASGQQQRSPGDMP